ncbi:hypothetical protein N7488_004603 [Penicillium malachiteum]|nr:hypothetical protein N7488_004603 [Penicillium malachiteum]
MSGLSRPRSKSGCWTCRTRKVKCDETRPHCGKCLKGRRQCDYAPRKRAPRGTGGRSQKAYAALCSKSDVVAIAPATSGLPLSKLVALEPDLPYGIKAEDWPFPLTATDRRAIDHYAANIVPRMVLKTARWSSYSYVLLMCAKHPLLAHLLIAFAIRDMAKDDDNDLLIRTIEHYQKALSLFIEHLSAPDVTGWITFPALWLFIQYEQSYGNSPNVLKAHLQGVRDIIVTHGAAILPGSLGGPNASPDEPLKYWVPPQMIDRMALWTIHHDARASTFGLGGSIISLLEEEYPGAIANICKNSTNALSDAWGPQYPAQEEIWDMRMEKFWIILHEATMLRFELSNIEKNDAIDPVKLISFGHKLRDLEQVHSVILKRYGLTVTHLNI